MIKISETLWYNNKKNFPLLCKTLVKKKKIFFPLLCLPDFLETFIVFFAWWDPWARSKRVAIAHLQLCDLWICTSVDNFFVFVIALKYGADFWQTW